MVEITKVGVMRQCKCNDFCTIVSVCVIFKKYNYVLSLIFHENAITILLLLASSSLSLPSTPAAFLIDEYS